MKLRRTIRIACVVAFLASIKLNAQFPTEWDWRSPQPTGNFLLSVAHGNGTWVGVGELGYIGTSTDGVFWNEVEAPTMTLLTKIQHAAGMWVAVGVNGVILTSPDAQSWTLQESGVDSELEDIAYGNGLWVAVGDGGTVLTSPDAEVWTAQDLGFPIPIRIRGVHYADGIWVGVGELGLIMTSEDGINWAADNPGQSEETLDDVYYGDGNWVIVGWFGVILSSTDAFTWFEEDSGTDADFLGIHFSEGRWVAVGGNFVDIDGQTQEIQTIINSTDVLTWQMSVPVGGLTLNDVIFANDIWMACSMGPVSVSGAGSEWLPSDPLLAFPNRTIHEHQGVYLVGSVEGVILRSDNGLDWERITLDDPPDPGPEDVNWIVGMHYADGKWIAVGDRSSYWVSEDSLEWTRNDAPEFAAFMDAYFANGSWVMVGGSEFDGGDGVMWRAGVDLDFEKVNHENGGRYRSVHYAQGKWVTVGDGGGIFTSTDTLNWTRQASPTVQRLRDVQFENGLWVAVGDTETVLVSADAETWESADSGTIFDLRSVEYADGMWVAVGDTLLTSLDGQVWQTEPAFTRGGLADLVFADGTWTIVGGTIDFWGMIVQSRTDTPDSVELTIARAGNQVVVSWPSTGGNHFLNAGMQVTGPFTRVETESEFEEGRLNVRVPILGPQKYFRLSSE